eukprot:scaffold329097_cov67-Tisochrysis_lutea.AAC.1
MRLFHSHLAHQECLPPRSSTLGAHLPVASSVAVELLLVVHHEAPNRHQIAQRPTSLGELATLERKYVQAATLQGLLPPFLVQDCEQEASQALRRPMDCSQRNGQTAMTAVY